MIYKIISTILAGMLILSFLWHFRSSDSCLKKVHEADGGEIVYAHVGSAGLTELIRDDDKDGIYELHDYTVELPGGMIGTLTILNPNDARIPEGISMRFGGYEGQHRNVSVTMLEPDSSGVYHACSVSFIGGSERNKVTYSDWNLDGRFDAQKLAGQEQWSVIYKGQWHPLLAGKPYEFPKFVTVMLGRKETRLVFRDGEFLPED